MAIYDRYDVVFQEIPNEVSLAFTMKGCINNCENCHSPHLRDKGGLFLNDEILLEIVNEYKESITCVLFLGGDAYHREIWDMCELLQDLGYKTAFYSGNDTINGDLVEVLDYYKVGSYQHNLGGLKSKTTNQRLYKIEDITKEFWNED